MNRRSASRLTTPFTLENDGLSQTSTRSVFTPGELHGPTKITVTTHLPPFVLPCYWEEYGLTRADVDMIAMNVPAQLFWLSVLVHGVDVVATCLKPSVVFADEVTITHKKDAIDILAALHKTQFKGTGTQSGLDCSQESIEHVPPLPRKYISPDKLTQVSSLLAPRLRALEICPVRGFFTFESTPNKLFLPIRYEGDSVYLQRATPYQNYERAKKRARFGLATTPFIVQTPDKAKFALCEESVLVSTHHITNKQEMF